MKKIQKILLIIGAAILLLGLFKNQIIKTTITTGASAVTGAPVQIKGLSFGVFKPGIKITGFRMLNPQGFPKENLLSMPKIEVRYSPIDMLKKKIHLPYVYIDIDEIGIVKDKDGKMNVDALKISQKQDTTQEQKTKKQPPAAMDMQIDELVLSVGKVIMKDYTAGKEPSVEVFDIGLKEKKFKNIKSAQQLAALILAEPLKHTTIKSAGIYGAATVLGVGLLPVGVAATLIGKDSAQETLQAPYEKVFETTVITLKKIGKITRQNETNGTIKAGVDGFAVSIEMKSEDKNTTDITISARKFAIPQPQKAAGILRQISENLNK